MTAMIAKTVTTFYPPNPQHDDVAVVAALYEQPYDDTRPTGKVYRDGTCSCSTFALVGSCKHVDEYEAAQCPSKRLVMVYRNGVTAVDPEWDYRQTVNDASYRQGAL